MKYKRHWSYLKYIVRHKWYVALAANRCGCSFWRALIHDASKFLPSEWSAYAYTFYDDDGNKRYAENDKFNEAWNHHQKRNKHHWQYWLLRMDRGDDVALPIPYKYIMEMVADWMGAGRAITGKWEVMEWYQKNKDTIILEPGTRDMVEYLLYKVYGWDGEFLFIPDWERM